MAHAKRYLPQLQAEVLERLGADGNSSLTLEDMLSQAQERALAQLQLSDWIPRMAMVLINDAIVDIALRDKLGAAVPGGVLRSIKKVDFARIDPKIFDLLPRTMRHWCDTQFLQWRTTLWSGLGFLLLVPLADQVAHALIKAATRRRERLVVAGH